MKQYVAMFIFGHCTDFLVKEMNFCPLSVDYAITDEVRDTETPEECAVRIAVTVNDFCKVTRHVHVITMKEGLAKVYYYAAQAEINERTPMICGGNDILINMAREYLREVNAYKLGNGGEK